jgi:hypothetical protein
MHYTWAIIILKITFLHYLDVWEHLSIMSADQGDKGFEKSDCTYWIWIA